jgi:hypothetical protein
MELTPILELTLTSNSRIEVKYHCSKPGLIQMQEGGNALQVMLIVIWARDGTEFEANELFEGTLEQLGQSLIVQVVSVLIGNKCPGQQIGAVFSQTAEMSQ